MKIFLRMMVLLILSLVFLALAIYSGRNWFLYATISAGTAGHPQLDSNMGTLGHLETEWYWAMVMSSVLVLSCWGLALLRLISKPGAD